MNRLSIFALRIVVGLVVAGAAFVQLIMVPMILMNSTPPSGQERITEYSFLAFLVLAGIIIEVCSYCVWKLGTRVRLGTEFDAASQKYVPPIIISFGLGSLLTFGFSAVLATSTQIAPGVVLLFADLGLLLLGIMVIVIVLRQLLIQATNTEAQAADLRAELRTVI